MKASEQIGQQLAYVHLISNERPSLLKAFRGPSLLAYLIHLERLPGVKILTTHAAWPIDELVVRFEYDSYPLSIEMVMGGDIDLIAEQNVPKDAFDRVVDHLKNYRRVWPHQIIVGRFRYGRQVAFFG